MLTHRLPRHYGAAWLGAVSLAACTTPPSGISHTDSAFPASPTTELSCAGDVWIDDCTDALHIEPGTQVQAVDVSWRWSSACLASTADPVLVSIPDGVDGLAITLDAGIIGTAFEWSRDGRPGVTRAQFGDLPHRMSFLPGRSTVWPIQPGAEPAPGCLAVYPLAEEVLDGEVGTLTVVSRSERPANRRLRVVGVVVEGTDITDAEVQLALEQTEDLYAEAAGIRFVMEEVVHLPFAPGDRIGLWGDRQDLLSQPLDLPKGPIVPIYFVSAFTAGNIVGVAAGIPGAMVAETSASGVVVTVDAHRSVEGDLDTTAMQSVIAHELGHQLGLWHTSERSGTAHDPLDDTSECTDEHDSDGDGTMDASECPDGLNLLFWEATPERQVHLTADQIYLLQRSPALLH